MSLDASNFPYPHHSCYILTFVKTIRLGWLSVSQQHWTWVFNVYCLFTDFGVSNVLPQPGSFALDLHVTLEFRPLGIFLPYSVFGSTGFNEISILGELNSFFFFNLLPNSRPFHLQVPITRILTNDMELKNMWITGFTPGMLMFSFPFFYLNIQLSNIYSITP